MKLDIARESALTILYKVEEEKGYVNLALEEYLNQNRDKLKIADVNLISEIVYGTTTWKLTIDTILQKYSSIKLHKISKWIRIILRMGIYQIVWLDKIPKHAVVNESVNLCKKYGPRSTGFVNAILRKVEKSDYEAFQNILDTKERLSKVYAIPLWIIQLWMKQYDLKTTEQICKASNARPNVNIRINLLKTNPTRLSEEFSKRNIVWEQSNKKSFMKVKQLKQIAKLDLFQEGYFTVQDEGAGAIAEELQPKKGDIVLDACSAPGGKTTQMAEMMGNEGYIMAWDLHKSRLKLVDENAKRLGISIIETKVKDATKYDSEYAETFDKVLLDVPCMGLGVLKRKPDIKWQKTPSELTKIQETQLQILDAGIHYLKPGGELIYSTCSLCKEENEDVIQTWYEAKPEDEKKQYKILRQRTILPTQENDGFFMCKIRKEEIQ